MADSDIDPDKSVLEKVDHLVDEMLGTDIAPAAPEDPWERPSADARLVDGDHPGGRGSGDHVGVVSGQPVVQCAVRCPVRLGDSAQRRHRAARRPRVSRWWTCRCGSPGRGGGGGSGKDRAGFLRDRFHPPRTGSRRSGWAPFRLTPKAIRRGCPTALRLNLASYVVPAQVQADAYPTRPRPAWPTPMRPATPAPHVMPAVLFALVLFFASVATEIHLTQDPGGLILIGLVLLFTTCVWMLLLPQML